MPEAPTEYYTSRYSGEEIDRGIDGALGLDPEGTGILSPEHGGTGAETAQGALAKLGAGVRQNLLDNAYFIGGGIQNSLPINQIGGKPDRWRFNTGGSVEINEASIAFTNTTGQEDGYYFQLVPLSKVKLGETYTASALLLSGSSLKYVEVVCYNSESPGYQVFGGNSVNAAGISSVTFTIPTNTTGVEFRFNVGPYGTVGSMEMVGGKLEEGKDQTLAYQDSDGNWQLLPQPDNQYGKQLLECQRYYSKSSQNIDGFSGGFLAETQPGSTEWLTVLARFPVSMVNVPTVTVPWISKATNISQNLAVEGIIVQPNAVSESGFNLLNVQGLTLESGAVYLVQFSSDASL